MPVGLNVTSNIKQEINFMNRLQKRFQRAAVEAINDTGFQVRRDVIKSLDEDLDRPTPFTKRGISIKKANLSTMTATVFVLPKQAEYLIRQVVPQERRAFDEYIIVPTSGSRRNRFGNLTRAARKKLFNKSIHRITETGDTVYIRKIRGGRLVAVLKKQTRYRIRRWDFYNHAEKSALRHFPTNLNRRIAEAERTLL